MKRWSLFLVSLVGQTAIALWGVALGAPDRETAGLLVRWTIRAAVVPFLMAFCASAVGTLWPGRVAEWLLDNRKYLGLGLTYGIALNMAAITWLVSFDPSVAWSGLSVLDRVESYGGLAVVAVMTVTSFDRCSRRMSLGAWRILHLFGMHALWWIFFRTNALYSLSAIQRGLLLDQWLYLLITLLLIGVLLLRTAASVKQLGGEATMSLPREPVVGR